MAFGGLSSKRFDNGDGVLTGSTPFSSTGDDSNTFTDSRPIEPWLMLELMGDGGTGAILDTQWSERVAVGVELRPDSDTLAVLLVRLVSVSRFGQRR